MQIIKTPMVKASEVGGSLENDPPLSPEMEEAITSDTVGFFGGEEAAPIEEEIFPTNPFDLLFSGTPGVAQISEGEPLSPQNFSAEKIPTLQDWLLQHPEGRFFLNKFILKMETIRDKEFVRYRKELETQLQGGGLSPSQIVATQKKLDEIGTIILNINQEIQKADQMKSGNQEHFEQEKIHMKDLNGDGYVGDPADKQNSYIVGKHPVTGKEVLLDPTTHQPAVNPYLDPNYMPAVADLESMTLLNKGAQEITRADGTLLPKEGKLAADAYLQIPDLKDHPPLMEFAASEGFWVRKDKNGKPTLDKDGSYVVKPFEMVTREDRKKMLGQTAPSTDEKGKWTFVAATDLNIFSSSTGDPQKGDHVFLEFKAKNGTVIARIRVQGRETNEESPAASGPVSGKFYIAATTLGVIINGGDGKHSSRIRPMDVDASGLHSTGVLQLSIGTLPEIGKKVEEIDARLNELKTVMEDLRGNVNNINSVAIPPDSDFFSKRDAILNLFGELERTTRANEQLPGPDRENIEDQINRAKGYFLSLVGETNNRFIGPFTDGYITSTQTVLSQIKNFNHEGRLASTVIQDTVRNAQSAASFMEAEQVSNLLKTASVRYSNKDDEEELRFGVAISGIRGIITGTQSNDIIAVPPPDDQRIRELLPVGAEIIDPSRAAYATYVNGQGGNNVIISKGGDLYADGVTFLWREAIEGKTGDFISVKTNNGSGKDNHKIFVHIDDPAPDWVKIFNGQDGDTENGEGVKDDVYEVPENAKFAMEQNDIPGGMGLKRIDPNLGTDIEENFSAIIGKITQEAIKADPLSSVEGAPKIEWDFGAAYDEWDKQSDSFFGEWEYFGMGGDETSAADLDLDEDVTL